MKAKIFFILTMILSSHTFAQALPKMQCSLSINEKAPINLPNAWKDGTMSGSYDFIYAFNEGKRTDRQPYSSIYGMTNGGLSRLELRYSPGFHNVLIVVYDELTAKEYLFNRCPKKDETYEFEVAEDYDLFGITDLRKLKFNCEISNPSVSTSEDEYCDEESSISTIGPNKLKH